MLFDPNVRPALIKDRAAALNQMDWWVERAAVVKASTEDLDWLYPERAVEDVMLDWIEQGATLALVTDGANGAFAATVQAAHWAAAPVVDVVDTVGAGDTFTAATLSWIARHGLNDLTEQQLTELLDYAMNLAGDTCTRAGGDPPRR